MFSLIYVGVFVRHCIVLNFGLNTKTLHFLSFELLIIMYRKVFGLKRRSSAREIFVLNNISNFEALMRKSIFAFTTQYTLRNF